MKSVSELLEERRTKAVRDRDARVTALYEREPALYRCVQKKRALGQKLLLAALNDNPEERNAFREALDACAQEETAYLQQLGLSPDFFEPDYACKKCGDTGNVNGKPCSCRRQLQIERNYDMSSVKSNLLRENFDTFALSRFRKDRQEGEPVSPYENMQHLLSRMRDEYVPLFTNRSPSLFFYGPQGVGKTFLLNCIAKGVLDRGYTVLYQSASPLLDFLLRYSFSFESERASLTERFQFCRTADLLLIDDLGSEYTTLPKITALFDLLNARHDAGLPIVISSNLQPEELEEQYNARIASRILGTFQMFELYGSDLRLQV